MLMNYFWRLNFVIYLFSETEDGSWLDWFLENPIVTYTIIGLAVAIMLVTGIGIIVCAIKYCRRKNTNYSAVNRSENIAMNNVS